jgi:hypothetical protein
MIARVHSSVRAAEGVHQTTQVEFTLDLDAHPFAVASDQLDRRLLSA